MRPCERPHPGGKRKLDMHQEAHLIALTCGPAPAGQAHWTMHLLADEFIELGMVERISDETMRRTLQKTAACPGTSTHGVILRVSAEFVCQMEDVLDRYAEPDDSTRPRVCVDERPVQLISEVHDMIPATPGHPKRHDYEYKREGTANLSMIACPERGERHVNVSDRRGTLDVAHVLKDLVDVYFPDTDRIRLLMDQLHTHTLTCLYAVFDASEARRIARKIEIHHTPKHGRWLNMAESEFAVLSDQCLNRRIPDQETLRRETAAWAARRNAINATIDWRFTSDAPARNWTDSILYNHCREPVGGYVLPGRVCGSCGNGTAQC